MIEFEGDRLFLQSPETVAARLSDAAFLLSCLDKVEHVVEATADKAQWKLRTGFSFLSTSLEITLTVKERAADQAKFEALSRGVGATSLVRAELTFHPADGGTRVHYRANVAERTGFLKVVSAGLIQAAAQTVIEDTWKGIEAKMQTETGPARGL